MLAAKEQAADIEDGHTIRLAVMRGARTAGFIAGAVDAATVGIQKLDSVWILWRVVEWRVVGQRISPLVAKVAEAGVNATNVNVRAFA